MKRIILAASVLSVLAFVTFRLMADDYAYHTTAGELMKCSPPKFMLIADVDSKAGTITAMFTGETQVPKSEETDKIAEGQTEMSMAVFAAHRMFKLTDVTVARVNGAVVDAEGIRNLKGRVVVLSEGKTPLSNAFLGLFRDDTLIVTVNGNESKK